MSVASLRELLLQGTITLLKNDVLRFIASLTMATIIRYTLQR